MNRRLTGLLAALCLTSACKEDPVGKMEPIAATPEMAANVLKARQAEKKPAPAPEPPPDPSKVTLRWKLDAPIAFRLTTTSESAPSAAKDKKGQDSESAAASGEASSIFVLEKTGSGDYAFRIVPQGEGGEAEQGTMSERGFVLDGLAGPLRNTAVLVLELPRDPVGKDSTWALGADLVDLGAVTNFVEKKAERKNQVKLTSLAPAENGEQVATLEYDLSESLSGQLRPQPPARKPKEAPGKKAAGGHDDHADEAAQAPTAQAASAEVRMTGRGEFLVKAGRWRSWEGTLTTHVEGTTLPGTANGERTLRLTPVDPVPPELLQPQAKK
ncbi:hypothetical protein JRI60_39440 [Archangium violaceum]|uniref:hypothetical protein n=1 Tax=Archangium violaceum TaxID=83451 RepID=UPI00194DCB06|nr:hypothetical protein [Archangium violaceum]QRN95107.1 hypothetical protein JRI60_39440 [Archangium violaceum]